MSNHRYASSPKTPTILIMAGGTGVIYFQE
jgi:hypothetical protein